MAFHLVFGFDRKQPDQVVKYWMLLMAVQLMAAVVSGIDAAADLDRSGAKLSRFDIQRISCVSISDLIDCQELSEFIDK